MKHDIRGVVPRPRSAEDDVSASSRTVRFVHHKHHKQSQYELYELSEFDSNLHTDLHKFQVESHEQVMVREARSRQRCR